MKKLQRLVALIAGVLSFGSVFNMSVNANSTEVNRLEKTVVKQFHDKHKIDEKYCECSLTECCDYLRIPKGTLVERLTKLKEHLGVKGFGVGIINKDFHEFYNIKGQVKDKVYLKYSSGEEVKTTRIIELKENVTFPYTYGACNKPC